MKKLLLTLLLLVSALRGSDLAIWGADLGLTGQSPWFYYDGGDAPNGAFNGTLGVGVSSLTAVVPLGQTLPAGTYYAFVKILDYDSGASLDLSIGGSNVGTVVANDRDSNRYWTSGVTLVLPAQSSDLTIVVNKVQDPSVPTHCLLLAVCITTEANMAVNKDDYLISYVYPTEEDYDTSPAVKGNRIPDGSFEGGATHGWGIASSIGRSQMMRDLWSATDGYDGAGCLALPAAPGSGFSIVSRPYHLKPNKQYTLSVWAKSVGELTGSPAAVVGVANAVIPPEGEGFEPQQFESAAITVTPTWQRISVTAYMLKYPESDYNIYLTARADSGIVLFDGLQLEEGTLTDFSTDISLGVTCVAANNLMYEDESPSFRVRAYNPTGGTVTPTANYQVVNYLNQVVQSGTSALSIGAGQVQTVDVALTSGKRGMFRVNVWLTGIPNSEDELVCSVLPHPATLALDTDSTIGTHIDFQNYQLAAMNKAGVHWTRGLSTGQCWRWERVEPTEGNFVWFDTEVARAAANNIAILANIGENAPTWALRTYFGTTITGGTGFTVGETITASGGKSGTVTVVLTNSNPTGHALQITPVAGTFALDDVITGGTSGTTATIRTATYPGSVALDKWDNYLDAVVDHYAADVAAWEIWNEPDQDGIEIPAPDGEMGFYAEIYRRAAIKVRALAPASLLVAGGGVSTAARLVELVTFLGGTSSIDAFSVHLYHPNGVTAESIKTDVIDVYGKPVWNTETGAWDFGSYSGVNANFAVTGRSLMPYRDGYRFYYGNHGVLSGVAQNFLQSIGWGLSKYFYYDARQSGSVPNYYRSHTTLFEYDEGLKAKGTMYSILGYFFDKATGLGGLTLSDAGSEGFLFDKSGVAMASLISTDLDTKEIDLTGLTGSIAVYDIMGNPVSVTNKTFRYGGTPVIIVGTGNTTAQLRTAIESATIVDIADTVTPSLLISVAPHSSDEGVFVRFRFFAIDEVSQAADVAPNAITYSWKLDGVDQSFGSWLPNTYVDYANLSAGTYTFRVKARDTALNTTTEQTRTFTVGAVTTTLNVTTANVTNIQ